MLTSATVQPLTMLHSGGRTRYVFFSIPGFAPELVFRSGKISAESGCTSETENGSVIVHGTPDARFSFSIDGRPVLVVPRSLALQGTRIDDEHMYFSSAMLFGTTTHVTLTSAGETECTVNVYPAIAQPDAHGASVSQRQPLSAEMSAFAVRFVPVECKADWREVSPHKFSLRVNPSIPADREVYLKVDYVGDNGMAFIDGEMIDDHLYFGRAWEIGLKRFLPRLRGGKEIVFAFHPMVRDATYYEDIPEAIRPKFAEDANEYLEVRGISLTPEYRAELVWPEKTP